MKEGSEKGEYVAQGPQTYLVKENDTDQVLCRNRIDIRQQGSWAIEEAKDRQDKPAQKVDTNKACQMMQSRKEQRAGQEEEKEDVQTVPEQTPLKLRREQAETDADMIETSTKCTITRTHVVQPPKRYGFE